MMNNVTNTDRDISFNLYNGYINTLRQALTDDTLAIFIGAGISHLTNEQYPFWGTVIDTLKDELPSSGETDYLKVAQLYNLVHGRVKTKKILRNCFPKIDKPGKLQEIILSLNPRYIITTNWDCLLDNEVIEKSLSYDIVSSDIELVESSLNNKIIKMHGDFNHDNFVFTEDDYLNYSGNLPLIENYIKSIMATHTILFLGYSFSDIDLKHIVNWLQHHSKARPPAFLAIPSNRYSFSEEKYLNKFGITILKLISFSNLDISTEYNLLKTINSNIPSIDCEPIDFVLSLLKPFDSMSKILQSQIRDRLTNVMFVHDKYSRAILQFTWGIATTDADSVKLSIYKNFIERIKNIDHESGLHKLEQIMNILKRADIHGIMLTSFFDKDQKYFNFDEEHHEKYFLDSKALNFDFAISRISDDDDIPSSLEDIQILSNLEEYEDAMNKTMTLIRRLRKNGEYKLLFLGIFNYNSLLHSLKFCFNTSRDHEYSDVKEIDLYDEFRKLPKKEQNECREIFNFYDFTYLYKNAFFVRQDLLKIDNLARTIESGGHAFSSDATRYSAEHKNLIDLFKNPRDAILTA
jgi:hypothetical protein